MQEEKFSPEESLQVIQSMIEKAKNQFSEDGHLYLLWGWVIFACSISEFVLFKIVHYEKHYYVWMACWVAVIYQIIYLRRKHKKQKVRTYTDKMVAFVWISFFVLMMLVGYGLSELGEVDGDKLTGPVFLAMYGVPTFLCGILLQFRPLVIGGIGCWALSIVAHFTNYDYQLLLLATAMIMAWIIPGYILQRKYHQQKN